MLHGFTFVWRLSFAAACLPLSICYGQESPVPTFGTTVVIPGGLVGTIYYLPVNTFKLPKFDKMKPVGTIYTKRLYVPPRDFTEGFPGITDRIEWFGIDFTGRFYIRNPGQYRFALCSDDGSQLYIDGKLAVDNHLHHPFTCRGGSVKLGGGIHRIRVPYFQGPRYAIGLTLTLAGPGDEEFRPFSTDEFAPPVHPEDWIYGNPDVLKTPPGRKPDARYD